MRATLVHHAARRRGSEWPLATRAQQPERMRRIGVLMAWPRTTQNHSRADGFRAGAAGIGLDRWPQHAHREPLGRGRYRALSQICGGIGCAGPDVILASGGTTVAALQRRAAPCRSCSRYASIRSAPASLQAWRGRAATPPDLPVRIRPRREMAGAAQRDRAARDTRGRRFGMPPRLKGSACSAPSVRGAVIRRWS